MSITNKEWGVVILTVIYAYGWAQGVWFHWLKPEKVKPEDPTIAP